MKSNIDLNEINALIKSFLIFKLAAKVIKFIIQKIKMTYLAKNGAKFIVIETIVAKTIIENKEHFIKLFSQ